MKHLLWPLLVAIAPAWADISLDGERSEVSFVSFKNVDVAEAHTFGRLSGTVDDTGMVAIEIALDSVDTKIPIRDERLREHLFDTEHYPTARVETKIDLTWLVSIGPGQTASLDLKAMLHLRGHATEVPMKVSINGVSNHAWQIVAQEPVLLNATNLGLDQGVRKLQEIAGLSSISLAVPVYFSLYFVAAEN